MELPIIAAHRNDAAIAAAQAAAHDALDRDLTRPIESHGSFGNGGEHT